MRTHTFTTSTFRTGMYDFHFLTSTLNYKLHLLKMKNSEKYQSEIL